MISISRRLGPPGHGSTASQFFLSVTFWAFGARQTASSGSEREPMRPRQGTNLADPSADFYPKRFPRKLWLLVMGMFPREPTEKAGCALWDLPGELMITYKLNA